jgi:hypothetical protein
MRRYIWVFVVGFLVVLPSLISAETNLTKSEPLRLTIQADKDVYGPDEPIHIEIRITNVKKTYLGPGKFHLTAKDDSSYVLIPKKIYAALMIKDKGHFELSVGSDALDDETMEKILTGKLEPLKREDFISIPPGYFYGRRFDIPPLPPQAKVKVQGKLRCSYRNIYPGEKAGITAWTGTIQSNVLDIRVQDKEK